MLFDVISEMVFRGIVTIVLIVIMVKLSELNARLTAQGVILDAIKTALDNVREAVLPADAEATLDANDAKLKAINDVLNPAPTP